MQTDEQTLRTFEESLQRCTQNPRFLSRFYEIFLAASPKVREKFVRTDFSHQIQVLRASFDIMVRAIKEGPGLQLDALAERHSHTQLDIGAEMYDLWLDSLLAAVKENDPQFTPEVGKAWEDVMMIGITYLLAWY